MKQKIDVEFYTIYIAIFYGRTSNFGYHKEHSIGKYSKVELNTEIKKYLSDKSDMHLHIKKKQERIKFKLNKKSWDLVIESEEY